MSSFCLSPPRRIHDGTAGVRVAGQLERELRARDGAVPVRPHGISLSESHLREARGRVLRAPSVLQSTAPHRILPHPSESFLYICVCVCVPLGHLEDRRGANEFLLIREMYFYICERGIAMERKVLLAMTFRRALFILELVYSFGSEFVQFWQCVNIVNGRILFGDFALCIEIFGTLLC